MNYRIKTEETLNSYRRVRKTNIKYPLPDPSATWLMDRDSPWEGEKSGNYFRVFSHLNKRQIGLLRQRV
jgi:hypothetical protein